MGRNELNSSRHPEGRKGSFTRREIVNRPTNTETRRDSLRAFGVSVLPRPESDIPIVSPDILNFPGTKAYPWMRVKESLQAQADETAKNAGDDVKLKLTSAPPGVEADFAVATHPLARILRKPPVVIAEDVAENFNAAQPEQRGLIREASALKGFVNFEIDPKPFGNAALSQIEEMGDRYGEVNIGDGKTVVIDSSSPNVAKFMGVAHLRSTAIGESLARIYQKTGHEVIRDNHLGDWGTQFGMLGRAYELWGDEIEGADTVKGLYTLYVRMHQEIEKEKADAKAAGAEGPIETSLEREGRAWFQRLEQGDPQASELLKWATEQSVKEFQRVYDLLGSKFEFTLGESAYVSMLPSLYQTLHERGIATKDERDALVINFPEDQKLDRLVVQKSDGASLYSSRDLATLVARTAWFKPDKILYVVGGDQKYYFRQVFAAFDKLVEGQDEKTPDVEHIPFGMMRLPDGKMSTRRGRVVFLEDVLKDSIQKAREKIDQTDRGLSDAEADEIARQVGVGAVIYSDLSQGRERDIVFDVDKALSLESNSAPYIQYAYVRARSILRKAEETDVRIDTHQQASFTADAEQDLIKHLAQFPQSIMAAQGENQPSNIAEYVYKTADLFNQLYNKLPILSEDDQNHRNSRLRLTQAASQVIKNGLYLLGIEAPEKM